MKHQYKIKHSSQQTHMMDGVFVRVITCIYQVNYDNDSGRDIVNASLVSVDQLIMAR